MNPKNIVLEKTVFYARFMPVNHGFTVLLQICHLQEQGKVHIDNAVIDYKSVTAE
jgi:uncharacterized membrane protein YfbV (UPF0208 family)